MKNQALEKEKPYHTSICFCCNRNLFSLSSRVQNTVHTGTSAMQGKRGSYEFFVFLILVSESLRKPLALFTSPLFCFTKSPLLD
jgi:hypothetical protein